MSRKREDTPVSDKGALRKQVLARRDALSAAERRSLSERITRRLLALNAYRGARCVMAYASFGSEFETGDFLADVLAQGKELVLPRVERGGRVLQLHSVHDPARQLAPGIWGIPQPRAESCPRVPASRLDFVLVPGVAFTPRCERLGYGAGYYDGFIRALARRPPLIAAAFSLQVLPVLPLSERDQSVDCVVTENAEYRP
ncbi:MAG: 5-formyltetrahydrofolate cyclo-ligase [Burkholderiales bacterium]